MSETPAVAALVELRDQIAADPKVSSDALDRAAGRDVVGTPRVTRSPGHAGTVELVEVDLRRPLELGDLATAFGPAARLPRRPSGGAPTVQFPATIPGDGEQGVTVLADLDEEGRAVRVTFRPDAF